jgi:hypothetical protein
MLTEQQLDKLAHQVVDRFLIEKVALTDGVVDTAQQENLNPEQIKRLVESVNNLTFLKKFNGTPSGQDRVVEFETANPNAAIQRLLEDAKTECNPGTEEAKTGAYNDLPFTRAGLPEALPEEKTAATPEPRLPDKGLTILKLRKTAELLEDQKYQARIGLTETLEDLATRFTRVGNVPFEAFEKDAFYNWGDAAGPHLQLLRQSLRLPVANYNHAMMTKIGRVIDTSTYEMQQLQKLMQYQRDIEQLENGHQKVAEYLERLR